jgi:hypothetical protein
MAVTEVPSQTCWTDGCDCDRCIIDLAEPDPVDNCLRRLDELNAEGAS